MIPPGTRQKPKLFTDCSNERSSLNSTRATIEEFRAAGLARMRESMARLTPLFSTNRVVRQYTEEHYLSAASAFQRTRRRTKVRWEPICSIGRPNSQSTGQRCDSVPPQLNRQDGQYFFQVQVFLDDLDPDAVSVELYAEGQNGNAPLRHAMNRGERLVGSVNGFMYTARIPATRPAADYTPRLVPHHRGAFVPLEAPFILWHDSPSWR